MAANWHLTLGDERGLWANIKVTLYLTCILFTPSNVTYMYVTTILCALCVCVHVYMHCV